ncbi:hypothetical protein niasHT_008664 [Heterodera trifolii]|uniref:Peptidase M41 domain-containing protein n=1 Tax=Heterodera trifolii TaxID=157864 RepID=A0ABD2LZV5_9BILA
MFNHSDIFERIERSLGNNFVVAGPMADGASRSGARHCSLLNPHAKKMSFVTCLPCFGRLGHVVSLRDGDSRAVTRDNLKADIGVALAGKIVEEMFNSGLSSSGCSSDLAKAKLVGKSKLNFASIPFMLAHDYVVTYGFSPIVTPPSDPGPQWQDRIDVEKDRVLHEAHLDVTARLGKRKDDQNHCVGIAG